MARRNRPTQVKREREQQKRDRQRKKAEKAAAKRQRRATARGTGAGTLDENAPRFAGLPEGEPSGLQTLPSDTRTPEPGLSRREPGEPGREHGGATHGTAPPQAG